MVGIMPEMCSRMPQRPGTQAKAEGLHGESGSAGSKPAMSGWDLREHGPMWCSNGETSSTGLLPLSSLLKLKHASHVCII